MIAHETFIDAVGQVSPDFLASKSLKTVLVYDVFRGVEAAWLSHAALQADDGSVNKLRAISYEVDNELRLDEFISLSRNSVLSYVNDKNLFHTVLLNAEADFLVYFAQFRDFFLICGSQTFLKDAYPVDSETIKFQYFDNLTVESSRGIIDREYFVQLWKKYEGFAF